jgi:hypothetical protein
MRKFSALDDDAHPTPFHTSEQAVPKEENEDDEFDYMVSL